MDMIKPVCDPKYLPNYKELLGACMKFHANSMNMRNTILWHAMIGKEEAPIFELWNSDYIDGLADYLRSVNAHTIVEVGAGNGRLTHFLKKRLPGVRIFAIDDFSWKIKPVFRVGNMSISAALNKYRPDIVISSWMPYMHDWTPIFRGCSSVKEYILIGETDGGCCGSDDTWNTENHKRDGFARRNLDHLSVMQICRTDYFDFDSDYRHSRTVAFYRR
jgi:hypothetical protein